MSAAIATAASSATRSIQRSAAAIPPTPAASVRPVRGMTVDGHVTIPASVGSLDHGAGRAVLAHELVHVQQQRDLGAAMPAPGSESAHRLESAARTAEAAVAWEELALARPGSRQSAADASAQAPVTVSRAMGAPTGRTATRAVHAAMQLADGDAPAPAPDTSAPSTSSSAPATAGGPTAGAAATMSDRDLDEMLQRLYPRLRRSLSSELLVARERAGMLADLR